MQGQSNCFLGITSAFEKYFFLAQGHNTARSVRIEPQPFALESETLPPGHRAFSDLLLVNKFFLSLID